METIASRQLAKTGSFHQAGAKINSAPVRKDG
jgi:hypothetical protein